MRVGIILLFMVVLLAHVIATRPLHTHGRVEADPAGLPRPLPGSSAGQQQCRSEWQEGARLGVWNPVWALHHMRGGSTTPTSKTTRQQMEERMKEERAKMAEEEEQIRTLQERKKRERDEANRQALVLLEVKEAEMQMVQKKRRRLPDVPTLEDLAVYGREMIAEGDADEAMMTYSRVLAIDPTDADALLNLAVLYQEAKSDLDTAEEMLKRAVDADAETLEAWVRLGKLHLLRRSETNMYGAHDEEQTQQRDASAEECYRKALALAPSNPHILTALGSILWHFKEDAQGAQELFARAVQVC